MSSTTSRKRKPDSAVAVADAPVKATLTVAGLAARERELFNAAEEIFRKLAAGEDATADEYALLRAAGPAITHGDRNTRVAYDKWMVRSIERCKTIAGLQTAAGSADDRQAALKSAAAAEQRFASRGAEIDAELRKLQAERAELASSANKTRAASDRQLIAVESLRAERLLPNLVQDHLHDIRRQHTSRFGAELATAESRLSQIDGILSWSPEEDCRKIRDHVTGAKELGGTADERRERFIRKGMSTEERVRIPEWAGYCLELRKEAARLRVRVTELEALRQEAAVEIDEVLSYYVPD